MFSTGVPRLDLIVGGGLPAGITELYGAEASGKTSLSLSILREAALAGHTTGYVAAEHFPDKDHMRTAGPGECVVASPAFGESGIEAAFSMLNAGCRVVCVDSCDALVPLAELDLDVGEREPLNQKRLIHHACKVLRPLAKKKNALVILISQVRVNPNERRPRPKSSFGNVIYFNADAVISLRRKKMRTKYGELDYSVSSATITRSSLCPPGGKTDFYIWGKLGIKRAFSLLRALIKSGVLASKGAYWCRGDTRVGPGYDSAVDQISQDYDFFWRLYEQHRD